MKITIQPDGTRIIEGTPDELKRYDVSAPAAPMLPPVIGPAPTPWPPAGAPRGPVPNYPHQDPHIIWCGGIVTTGPTA